MEHAAEALGEATAAEAEEAQAPGEVPALGGLPEEPAATLLERFTGYDSFTEAMLEHGRTLERPLSWNRWRHVAGQVAPAYPGEPRDANSWSAVRTSTYTTLFGSEWKTLVDNTSLARVEAARRESVDAGIASGGWPGASGAAVQVRERALPVGSAGAAPAPGPTAAQRPERIVEDLTRELLRPQAQAVIADLDVPDGSETSSNYAGRVAELAERLVEAGVSEEATVLATGAAGWTRVHVLEWQRLAEEARPGVAAFALSRLQDQDVWYGTHVNDLASKVISLCQLSNMSPENQAQQMEAVAGVILQAREEDRARTPIPTPPRTPTPTLPGQGPGVYVHMGTPPRVDAHPVGSAGVGVDTPREGTPEPSSGASRGSPPRWVFNSPGPSGGGSQV